MAVELLLLYVHVYGGDVRYFQHVLYIILCVITVSTQVLVCGEKSVFIKIPSFAHSITIIFAANTILIVYI